MKKLYIIILLLLATFRVSAQEMPSVAGVTFGWTYEQCKEVLDKKFGKKGSWGGFNQLSYRNVYLGGHLFDIVFFGFQSDGKKTYLYFVSLTSLFDFNEEAKALQFSDELFKTYSKKYNYRYKNINSDGYTYYLLGENPFKPEAELIMISTIKTDIEGIKKICSNVNYGPIEFVKPEDEI